MIYKNLLLAGGAKSTTEPVEHWTYSSITPTNMPSVRSYVSFTSLNDKLYMFGGNINTSSTYTNQIYEFAPLTNSWTFKTAIPFANFYWGISSAPYNGNIYVATGMNNTNLCLFNPTANTCTTVGTVPATLMSSSMACIGTKLYIYGGDVSGTTQSIMRVFDITAGTWSVGPSGPPAKSRHTAVVINNKMYIHGGTSDGSSANAAKDVWEFDPATNAWTRKADAIQAAFNHSSCVLNNKMYVFGGVQKSGDAIIGTKLRSYNPVTNVWTQYDSNTASRAGCAFGTYSGQLYIFGGLIPDVLPTYSPLGTMQKVVKT